MSQIFQCCIKCFDRIKNKKASDRKICDNCWSNGKGHVEKRSVSTKVFTMYDQMAEKDVFTLHRSR